MALLTPFTFSQSSLQDYGDCSRRFQLRYIDQLSWPAIESEPLLEGEKHQQEGQLFHRLIQQYFLGLPIDKLAKHANTPDLARWWKNFIVWSKDLSAHPDSERFHPESTLSMPIGSHRLLAKYDLLIVADNHARIYDWKTNAKRPREDWLAARWQTRVYRSLLTRAGSHLNAGQPLIPEQIEMVYWFAEYPSEPAIFKYDSKQFKRDWSAIQKAVKEIGSAREFPMVDDEKTCRFCTYRSYCNRGSKAGTLDEGFGDLAAEDGFDVNHEQIGEIDF
jgi:PD-(D/E)XK nuclease superfamily